MFTPCPWMSDTNVVCQAILVWNRSTQRILCTVTTSGQTHKWATKYISTRPGRTAREQQQPACNKLRLKQQWNAWLVFMSFPLGVLVFVPAGVDRPRQMRPFAGIRLQKREIAVEEEEGKPLSRVKSFNKEIWANKINEKCLKNFTLIS